VRIGLVLTTLMYLVYSSFGIAAPFWWGHHGYHGATYMLRARMSLRFHMLAPATFTGFDFPTSDAYYFHHPVGYHHILTLLVPIFGEKEWLARGVAVAGGLLTLWALYALVRRMWSREAGLVAVFVYVTLPVVTSFSVLSDPMLLEMACVLWGLNAYFELLQKPSWRALWAAAAAYFLGGLLMWEVFFIGPFIAVHALAYSLTGRGERLRLGPFNAARLHVWFIGGACAAAMAFHIWFTARTGMWADFLDSYRIRHSPPSAPYVIDRHTQWMDLLYGRAPIVFAAAWFVVWLARVANGRARLRDLAPLTILYVNTLYIYMFAEGSSVHLYRVFFYSGFFALAVTDLVDDARRAGTALWRRESWAGAAAGALVLFAYLGAELPHAWHNWIDSRVLMGTHGESHFDPEQHKMVFAQEVTRRTKPDERVIIHYGQLGARKEMWFYLDRSFDNINSLAELERLTPNFGKSWLILDELTLTPYDRVRYEQLLSHHPVSFYDHFALIDLRTNQPGVSSWGFVAGRMSRGYRWWISHKYPPVHLERIGYLRGICTALDKGVPIARDEAAAPWPADLRQLPCYRNYLALRGESVAAADEKLLAGMQKIAVPLSTAKVVAVAHSGGRLKIAIQAAGPPTEEGGELRYVVRHAGAVLQVANRSSALPPPSRWRAGFLYFDEVPLAGGDLSVELVTAPKPPVTLPPGRFSVRSPSPPLSPPEINATAALP
jgi:hypothetical protein